MLFFLYYSLLQVTLMPVVGAIWCTTYTIRRRKNPRFKIGSDAVAIKHRARCAELVDP